MLSLDTFQLDMFNMHNENIIITKEQREAMLERVEVLQKVKAFLLIPKLFLATSQQVASFFEVELSAVQKCYSATRRNWMLTAC